MRTAALACLLLLLSACSTYRHRYFVSAEDYPIASVTRPDGGTDAFELHVQPATGDASLELRSLGHQPRNSLGVRAQELDKAEAERRGTKPYSGLLVTGFDPESAAQKAGLLAGDVLLAIDGKETVYLNQLPQIEAALVPEQAVTAKVLRGQTPLELQVSAHRIDEPTSERQSIPLEEPPTNKPYAGVTLRGIPAPWCEKMFGSPRNAVVISMVEPGSPAWLAGFRGGDLIDAVDGGAVPEVRELARQIADRGARHESIRLRASRGSSDVHEADIALRDYSVTKEVWVPLVFHDREGVLQDKWSVGPFGLLVADRSTCVADNRSRDTKTENVFSAVLGLIHV
ncbi:MAG TPA: PDZ domain-containing protein, partial [Planctomycetota bacterium]|nr:PDZ domain-containing protein [Planctomycetota bacterium]